MAAAPVKSQPLHNFTLPSFLKWGGGRNHASSSHPRHRHSPPPPAAESSEQEPDRIDSESDSRAHRIGSRNRFSLSPCVTGERRRRQPKVEVEIVVESEELEASGKKRDGGDEAEETVQKPWNLRPRRGSASSRAPVLYQSGESPETMSPARSVAAVQPGSESQPKSLRLRGETVDGEKKEKRKLWIALSREEIEEDIFVMTGSRPARRPQKRPKNVQKHLENVCPGQWLIGASVDAFRVAENPYKK